MADKVYFVGPWERVLYLRTVPALRGLGSKELVRVAQFAGERFHPKGSFLFERERRPEAFHVVVEGRVRVQRPNRPPQTIGPREVVGFLHLLAGSEGGLEARAETETLTLEFEADIQWDLCEEHFPILLNYARFLGESLIALEGAGCPPQPSASPARVSPPMPKGPELVERILALYGSDAFCNCSLDALGELARHLSEARFGAGDRIWEAGRRSDWFLLLRSGALSMEGGTAFWAGQVVGMEESLAGTLHGGCLRAVEESTALRIDKEPFLDILEDHFEMAMALLSTMAARLLEAQERAARRATENLHRTGGGLKTQGGASPG